MKKQVLKLIMIFCFLFVYDFLIHSFISQQSVLFFILHVITTVFFAILLFVILLALVPEVQKKGRSSYLKTKYQNIEVSFLWQLNGGGIIQANEFVRIVAQKIGKVGHVFEYCAGPGFIGFSLLANNLCDRLTLADVNPKAVKAINETIKNNNLQEKVTVYQSDCLDSIPKSEQWDLVVGNPPWHLCSKKKKGSVLRDPQGRVHKKFYRNINKFLKPNGSILFIEGGEYTNVRDFQEMIEDNGLHLVESFRPVSLLDLFKGMNEYPGLRKSFIFTLRFMLFARETYFIWSKGKTSEIEGRLDKGVLV